jgi:1-acyl-sn-glycerol-3-phosphate acyltransferase
VIGRRLVTIPLVLLLTAVAAFLALPLLVLAGVVDLVSRRRGWPTVRTVLFFVAFLLVETFSLLRLAWFWLSQPFSRRSLAERLHGHMHAGAGLLMVLAEAICNLRLETEAPDDLGPGPLIVLGQHVSTIDAVIPAFVLGTQRGWRVRFVLADELRFLPTLDIVGHRLPNAFVTRGDDTAADLAAIRDLASGMPPTDLVAIAPGGGLFTPERLARAQARVEGADHFRHVLPPRPGGVLACLDAAPEAAVVVLGHRGFEPLGSVRRLHRVLPLTEPVRVKVWRHDPSEVPEGDGAKLAWVDERWTALDDWIDG